jgi:probable rRNA maturation factor
MDTDGDRSLLFQRAGKGFSRRDVAAFARRLREEVAGSRPFTCLLTNDARLRRLNRDFLGNDYPTDVLSFPEEGGSESPESGDCASVVPSLGEIAISADRAREQAAEFGHSVEEEIGILMLHGLLHLLGLDHETDRGKMARVERKWRERLALPGGLIERTRQ